MSIPSLIRSYVTTAVVAACTIVKFTDASATSKVGPAAANTDPLWGIADAQGGDSGDTVDVILDGLAEVKLGGTVQAGDPLTSDANAAAIKATPSATNIVRVIAWAEQPGVAGDIIRAKVERSVIHIGAS